MYQMVDVALKTGSTNNFSHEELVAVRIASAGSCVLILLAGFYQLAAPKNHKKIGWK